MQVVLGGVSSLKGLESRWGAPSLPGKPRLRIYVCLFLSSVTLHCPAEASVSFRGRSLKGKEVLVPEGYMGLVLEEDDAALQVSCWVGGAWRGEG